MIYFNEISATICTAQNGRSNILVTPPGGHKKSYAHGDELDDREGQDAPNDTRGYPSLLRRAFVCEEKRNDDHHC